MAPKCAEAGQITSNRRLDDGTPEIGAARCRIAIQRHFTTLTA